MNNPHVRLALTNLKCAGCVRKIEQALQAEPQTVSASVSLADKSATVESSASPERLVSIIENLGFGASILPPAETRQFSVTSMNCASCVSKIENALNTLPGVENISINLSSKTASVEGYAETAVILNTLEQAGFPAQLIDAEQDFLKQQEQADKLRYRYLLKHMGFALSLGIPLMLWGMITGDMSVETTQQQLVWGSVGVLTFLILAISGKHFFTGMWKSLKHGNANMDTLIATGTGVAWLYSMFVVLFPDVIPANARHIYFEASAMIIGLINLGQAMELRARGKTGKAIKKLMGLQAKTARVVRDGEERDIPVEQVIKGDIVRIRPGERIPVDGVVTDGSTYMDESMLTGEPVAASKNVGDSVSAGTINKNGSILFQAERVGSETALAHIIALVKKAQSSKMPIARLADRIASVFVPTVMAIAVIAAAIWFFFGPEPRIVHMMVVATTVLIIACPCALGLATPMSVMAGVGKAAELGILVRSGEALQKAARITTVVLDKTGTITEGSPKVTGIITHGNFSADDVLVYAASLEAASEHPLAEAIVASAKEKQLVLQPVRGFEAFTGTGVSGTVNDQQLLLGNSKLMAEHNINVDALVDQATQQASEGSTPVYLAVNGQAAGIVVIADPARADSAEAIHRLHALGIRVVMLTGDNRLTASAVASEVGIDQFFAEVMPADKEQYVQKLQQEGHVVGMTGDGINDAPALARADAGFAIGTGTDVAIESADITLMRSSLHGLADAIELSRATLKNIKQNLFGAFVYNSLGIPVAAGVLYPVTGMLLNPVIAGAAMAMSSVTVITNANRLRLFKPKR